MFVTEKLVFLELHKTGCTHIRRLLDEVVGGGIRDGKHNRLAPKYFDRFILGSVRNPWDWYVSLWAYGCAGKGSVRYQVLDGPNWRYYREDLMVEMQPGLAAPRYVLDSFLHDRSKNTSEWEDLYADAMSPELFQAWLKRLLSGEHALDVREGYGFSPLSQSAGLMTYRYVKLFAMESMSIHTDAKLTDYDYLRSRFYELELTNAMIRNENLEKDFLKALALSGYQLRDEQREEILGAVTEKTNTSMRKPASFYYDDECTALVAEKDKLIIERHDYLPPK